MDKRKRYTAEEKMRILREVLEDGKPISQTAEQYGSTRIISSPGGSSFSRGGIQVFPIKRPDISGKAEERKIAELESKLKQKDEAIAEFAEELLGLKKKEFWPSVGKSNMSLGAREAAEGEIKRFNAKTGLSLETLLKYAGIPERTWREWSERRGAETKRNNNIPRHHYLTPEEVGAIIAYCAANPLKGYRMLCWEMVDENIACVSCSSAYTVIKRHGLDKKRAEPMELAKRGFDQPVAVHEQWRIDFSYIKRGGGFLLFPWDS